MSIFTEEELEQAALSWLEELGYELHFGPDIAPDGPIPERRDYSEVVLVERLRDALDIINPHIPASAINEAVRKVTITQSPDPIINNRAFHKMITDGVDVEVRRADGSIKTDKVWLFDFARSERNDWLAVNQFTIIENNKTRRPDVVVFINGLPLAVFELKSATNEEATISKAYNQLQTYKKQIPSLFTYNELLVTSDGLNARVGTLTANEEWFTLWRTMDDDELAPEALPQLEVLIKGMFHRERFLDILRHFILFQTDGSKTIKILAAYHQVQAVNKAIEGTIRATAEKGDRKIGVVWHTQGSGKSFTMVFYTGKLVLTLDNPTIVVITDRNDLDDQLFNTFSLSHELLRQTPQQAENRGHLRELLKVESGGIIFTTIQKFAPEEQGDSHPILTDRRNVVVIADEAHRSQYGFKADVVKISEAKGSRAGKKAQLLAADSPLDGTYIPQTAQADELIAAEAGNKDYQEALIKYGYAKYLRDALPNASYIGFTGTPVEAADRNTPAVFGDYIDIYDMTRAVMDGATVRIYYESRIAKIDLPEGERPRLDHGFEDIAENQEESTKDRLKSKWARLEAVVGAEKRLKLIARDIVKHYETRANASFGKAMIVVMSRRIAVDLYEEIIKLRPHWYDADDDKGKIKIVMTGSASDPEHWQQHIGGKKRRDFLAKRMKDNNDPLQIVIVRDMWLTGFDVPAMNTMYIDKPMKGHNLMQAIARVNRVFRDKPGGLVVDYIGIAEFLKEALAQYTDSDRRTTGIDTAEAIAIMLEKYEVVKDILNDFDYQPFLTGKPTEKMATLAAAVDYILSLEEERKKSFLHHVTELAQAYSLCSTTPEAEAINVEIGFFKSIKAGINKLISIDKPKKTQDQLDAAVNQLVSKSIISEEVVDILGSLGMDRPDISILSDEFLEEVKGLKQKNIAVELLKRLLNGKIRSIARRNLIKSQKFSEMLENAIKKYQNRAIETTQVILELIELAKAMNKAHKEGQNLGLTEDEIAFYDALGVNDAAVKIMGDEVLKQIARELTKAIKSNLSIDWEKRESVRAQLRVTIKRLLKKYKYPPDKQAQAVETVIKQAELMCSA